MLNPIIRVRERVETGRSDSDTTLSTDLMYYGELVVKLTVAGLIGAVEDDRERSRYRLLHGLVRADGIGDWAKALDDILAGPAARRLNDEARIESRELFERCGEGSWQYDACSLMHSCIRVVDSDFEDIPAKLDGRRWAHYFARLRNKTRGHGAALTSRLAEICPALEQSIRQFTDNFWLFEREWVYLHRNLSGKYRVTKLSETDRGFDELKSAQVQRGLKIDPQNDYCQRLAEQLRVK